MDYRAQPGPEYYTNRKDTPLEDRPTILKEKYGKMALICLCKYGQRSKTFISNESMDATLYIKKCLKMLLLPFIR